MTDFYEIYDQCRALEEKVIAEMLRLDKAGVPVLGRTYEITREEANMLSTAVVVDEPPEKGPYFRLHNAMLIIK